MKKIQQIIAMTLILTCATHALNAQVCESEPCCSAYAESSRSAHWSVYVPIVVLVGAAILFGVADRSKGSDCSSGSQDALGSIDNSKRHSSGSYSNSYSYRSSCWRSKAILSH